MRKYTIFTETVSSSKVLESGHNAIFIKNIGVDTALVNGESLAVGDPPIINNGLEGEEDHTQYTISFQGNDPGNQLVVRRKVYIKP